MSKEEKNEVSVNETGSTQNGPSIEGEPTKSSGGQEEVDLDNYIPKTQYEELEKKIGAQGQELGEYRDFIRGIEPLLEKLQGNDDLIQAIVDGHITSDLAKAVMEGKVNLSDAKKVSEAHDKVKEELGAKKYSNTSPEEIEKLVTEKIRSEIDSFKKTIKGDISSLEDRREFENGVNRFIENTQDFSDYAEDVVKWLDEHPDIYDIETAYFAVKGKKAALSAKEQADINAAEEAKKIALNAAGGGSQGTTYTADKDIVSELIAPARNPNNII